MSEYLTPEQLVPVFGYDAHDRPIITKHEIRRHIKDSGIYSVMSRGKIALDTDQVEELKDWIKTRHTNRVTADGDVDNFAA